MLWVPRRSVLNDDGALASRSQHRKPGRSMLCSFGTVRSPARHVALPKPHSRPVDALATLTTESRLLEMASATACEQDATTMTSSVTHFEIYAEEPAKLAEFYRDAARVAGRQGARHRLLADRHRLPGGQGHRRRTCSGRSPGRAAGCTTSTSIRSMTPSSDSWSSAARGATEDRSAEGRLVCRRGRPRRQHLRHLAGRPVGDADARTRSLSQNTKPETETRRSFMRYTDDALYPENMQPLIITAAPYGPTWLPGDAPDIAVTWDEQVQAAVDCFNAGARVLHLHVRNPATGHLSADIEHYNFMMARLKEAVPKMIIQVGGSIAFSPKGDGDKAKWLDYDTRHMLAEITPAPETVTVAIGTSMFDITQMWTADDVKGTHLEDPKVIAAYAGMYHRRRSGLLPGAPEAPASEEDPALFHAGARAPARDRRAADPPRRLHGPAEHQHHHVWRRRVRPQSVRLDALAPTRTAGCGRHLLGRHADQCGRPADGHHPGSARARRHRGQPLEQQAGAHDVGGPDQGGRATSASGSAARLRPPEEARKIMKIGVWYDSVDETLKNLGMPPNRGDDDRGFMVWETDGKKSVQHQISDSHPMAYCMVPPGLTDK